MSEDKVTQKKIFEKVTQKKIFENDQLVAFKNPITDGIKIYKKLTDDFHNVFTKVIAHIQSDGRIYNSNIDEDLTKLLYSLLIKGEENV